MLITMTSSRNLTAPVKFTQFSTSSPCLFHPVTTKSCTQNVRFVGTPVKLFLGLRSGSEDAQLTTILSATDSDNAITEPSTTDSSIAETTVTSNQPPLPIVQAEGRATPQVQKPGSNRAPLTATNSDNAITEPSTTDSSIAETTVTINQPPLPIVQAEGRATPQVQKPGSNRAPLTAREKLRAARVLSRYTESKPSKRALGSKVLDALRESDGGKGRSGLPQAPTNLFDDSKRGMPKKGLTFDLPGGADLFFIVLSFVLITTVMFSTTYIVWKLGAIHFNEY